MKSLFSHPVAVLLELLLHRNLFELVSTPPSSKMSWRNSRTYIVHLLLLSLCLASPLVHLGSEPGTPRRSLKSSKWNAAELNNEFKGIYWDHIVNEPTNCTPEQLDKIVWSTRATMWLLEGPPKDMEYAYSDAWTRYSGNYTNWLVHGGEIKKIADDIQCKLVKTPH
jgi:hypothetical protein